MQVNQILKKRNVVLNTTDNKKHVVREEREISDDEIYICEKPHQDGDFSYLCGSDYCRCCS
jgi:hypothetical protein